MKNNDENIKLLKEKFNEIKKLNWIRLYKKDTGYMGTKLEELLDLQSNNFEIPDFNGIEIKTKQDNCQSEYFTLFNATPYGSEFFEIKRIVNKFGYPDKDLKEKKVFSGDILANKLNKIGRNYFFSLKVNQEQKKVFLTVYDYYMNIIDRSSYWSFDILKEKLERKVTYLALFKIKIV